MLEFSLKVKSYASRNIGFGLFLAWNYIALYGCAMAVGTFVPYNLEYIWIVAGATELLCGLAGLGLVRYRSVLYRRAWGIVGAVCAVAGNVMLWLSYIIIELYWTTFVVAGALMGVGIALMAAVWGSRLASCNYSKIEFDVLASFLLAFALYSVTLPIKLYGVVNLVVASVLPVVSMVLAFRKPLEDDDGAEKGVSGASCDTREEMRRSASTFVMITLLWFLIAFLRVLLSPIESYDRFQHYFFPFFFAFVLTIGLFVVFIKVTRYLSVTLAYRWALPFMLLGLGVWSFDPHNLGVQIVAYSLNFMGMFGVQISCWIAVAKYLHRRKESSLAVLFGFVGSEGLGILAGCGAGLVAVAWLDAAALIACSLIVLAGAVFAIMLAGFNPYWHLDIRSRRAPGRELSGESTHQGTADMPDVETSARRDVGDDSQFPLGSEGDYLAEALRRQAVLMQRDYGLTDRETEIVELLLAGRSRPYIRDELLISLNTVHSHASNIFAKCEVHSQQELIDLVHAR